MTKLSKLVFVVALLLFGCGVAGASVVTSLPGGTVVPMPVVNYFGPGPQSFGSGITWTSTNAANQGGSVFGYTGGYGFGGNGSWDGALTMAGLNDSLDAWGVTDTMTFAFSTPVYGVGGFLNYVPYGSTVTTIAVFDAAHSLLESYNLTFVVGTGTDLGGFYGFLRANPDISYFTLTDNYIGIANLSVQSTATPEPATLVLLGLGIAGLGFCRRRKA